MEEKETIQAQEEEQHQETVQKTTQEQSKKDPTILAEEYVEDFDDDAEFNPYSLQEAFIAGYCEVRNISEEDEKLYERVLNIAENYKEQFIREECGGAITPFSVSDEDVMFAHLQGQYLATSDLKEDKQNS